MKAEDYFPKPFLNFLLGDLRRSGKTAYWCHWKPTILQGWVFVRWFGRGE